LTRPITLEEPMNITPTSPRWRWLRNAVLPAATIGALALAGCSSSGSGGGTGGGTQSAGANPPGSASMTVTVRDASGHKGVLATADGHTLYESDQENGKVLCKSSECTAIWLPLTVSAGQTPSGPSGLSGTLSTIMRPDGKTQVALDSKPLYTFSFDHGAGKADGDGEQDSFDGTHFTWQVATATGVGAPAPSAPAPSAPASSDDSYTY
jgi:predicted lipoprotein with Yx(FWY)xxD motif